MTSNIFAGNVITIGSIVKENGAILDISTATVKRIRVKSPEGSAEELDATFQSDGTDGVIEVSGYEVKSEGTYIYQPYIVMGGFRGYGEASSFVAREKI